MLIPYYLFEWRVPELSLPERISLGREVAKVGRKAFVDAFKQRLVPGTSKDKSFTLTDVISDARKKRTTHPQTVRAKIVAALLLGGCFLVLLASGLIIVFLIAMAVVGPISLGSMWWTFRKIDRWAQSLVDDYTHALANDFPKTDLVPAK